VILLNPAAPLRQNGGCDPRTLGGGSRRDLCTNVRPGLIARYDLMTMLDEFSQAS
jgi:hypothetical protein